MANGDAYEITQAVFLKVFSPPLAAPRRFSCLLRAMMDFYRLLLLLSGKLIVYFEVELQLMRHEQTEEII